MLVSIILGSYLGLAALYMLFFALMAKLPSKKQDIETKKFHRFAVLIPAYKEDAVILDVAQKALKQNYPCNHFEVIIIADSLQEKTLDNLSKLDIKVIEVNFDKSTKAKALNYALDQLPEDDYDIALVLDADNIMEKDFLLKMNQAFGEGHEVIQGRRVAKNTDSNFAKLDAISEAINNNIYNLGHAKIGISARLVGSGMAFNYHFFKKIMLGIDAIGGFDKELELKFIERKLFIHYLHDAIVYDEKVDKAAVFGSQRKRWIAAQFYYAKKYFGRAIWALLTEGKLDFFNKAYQMILPPRLLIPVLLFLGTLINLILLPDLWLFWALGLGANVLANLISIPRSFYNLGTLNALLSLPKALFQVIKVMFGLKGANKNFIHTPHHSK
ncbi:MAG: glycosyltransferase [Saprospiraceae bacterium]|nr:glycosyltransferase [Saprospiraceae bacterium]